MIENLNYTLILIWINAKEYSYVISFKDKIYFGKIVNFLKAFFFSHVFFNDVFTYNYIICFKISIYF
jgi:hypothetical protein